MRPFDNAMRPLWIQRRITAHERSRRRRQAQQKASGTSLITSCPKESTHRTRCSATRFTSRLLQRITGGRELAHQGAPAQSCHPPQAVGRHACNCPGKQSQRPPITGHAETSRGSGFNGSCNRCRAASTAEQEQFRPSHRCPLREQRSDAPGCAASHRTCNARSSSGHADPSVNHSPLNGITQ